MPLTCEQEESWDEDDELDDLLDDAWKLHPALIPWLRKKLGLRRLGTEMERYLKERLSLEYDLIQHPEALSGIEQERLLRDVRQLHDYEQGLLERLEAQTLRQAGTEAGKALRQALLLFREEEESPQGEAGWAARAGSQKPPAREQREQDLLSPVERDAAAAVTAHLGALLSSFPPVQQFRQAVLSAPERRLTLAEADEFIRSPAVRLLSPSDWKAEGILWEAEGVDSVLASEQFHSLDDRQAKRRRERAQASADASLVWREDMPANDPNYLCWHVTLRVTRGLPKRRKTLHKEWMKPWNEPPLWIPFLPADVKSVHDDRGDGTFPQMFPGSVAHELARLSEQMAPALGSWESWQMALFVLTGDLGSMHPVRVRTLGPAGAALRTADPAALWDLQQRRLGSGTPLRGQMQIVAEPWVSAATIGRYWQAAQKQVLGTKRLHRFPGRGTLKMVAFVAQVFGRTGEKEETPPLIRLHAEARDAAGKPLYGSDYSSFLKAYKHACRMLELPWDLRGILQSKNRSKKW